MLQPENTNEVNFFHLLCFPLAIVKPAEPFLAISVFPEESERNTMYFVLPIVSDEQLPTPCVNPTSTLSKNDFGSCNKERNMLKKLSTHNQSFPSVNEEQFATHCINPTSTLSKHYFGSCNKKRNMPKKLSTLSP